MVFNRDNSPLPFKYLNFTPLIQKQQPKTTQISIKFNHKFYQILYIIFDCPHKHYTFKQFEV